MNDGAGAGRTRPADSVEELNFTALYQEYSPRVRAHVRRRLRDSNAVDDVVQETFVRAYRAQHQLDPTRSPWPWLATIATRLCLDHGRWERRHPEAGDDIPDRATDRRDVDPEATYLATECAAVMDTALARLAERHRRVLVMREIGYGYDDLAELEGLSIVALKSLLARARALLRANYEAITDDVRTALLGWRPLGRSHRWLTSRRDALATSVNDAGLAGLAPALANASAYLAAAGVSLLLTFSGLAPTAVAGASPARGLAATAAQGPATSNRAPSPAGSASIGGSPSSSGARTSRSVQYGEHSPASVGASEKHDRAPDHQTLTQIVIVDAGGWNVTLTNPATVPCDSRPSSTVLCAVADRTP